VTSAPAWEDIPASPVMQSCSLAASLPGPWMDAFSGVQVLRSPALLSALTGTIVPGCGVRIDWTTTEENGLLGCLRSSVRHISQEASSSSRGAS